MDPLVMLDAGREFLRDMWAAGPFAAVVLTAVGAVIGGRLARLA